MEVLTIDIKAKEGFVEEKNYLPSKKKATKQPCTISITCGKSQMQTSCHVLCKASLLSETFWLAWCWSPGQANGEDPRDALLVFGTLWAPLLNTEILQRCSLGPSQPSLPLAPAWPHVERNELRKWEVSVDLKMKEKQSLSSFLIKPWDDCFKKKECAAQLRIHSWHTCFASQSWLW